MNYTIQPLEVGRLTVDRSTLTYMRGFGLPAVVPIIIWVVRNGSKTYIVDTGAGEPAFTSKHHGPMQQLKEQEPSRALRDAGINPDQVTAVIISHLHFDHASNNKLFPRADFLVQRRELQYAANPLPIHARGYEHPKAGFDQPAFDGTRWTLVDGDQVIAPGLTVLLTPGHTPGLQAVLVETASGAVVLASDNVPLYDNWAGDPPLVPHIPSGVHVDLREYFASFAKLERLGGEVVPSHDPRVLEWSLRSRT
jgi:glyoxylase-like metal-dependent hydrolase (beta-lactamase superfamily II)